MADSDSTPGKSPAFQFYPNDFTSGTADLPAEDVGVYVRLLCYQWNKGVIPGDTSAQARIGGVSSARMRSVWTRLKRHFATIRGGFRNERLEREREKQASFHRRQSDASKKRWDKHRESHGNATASTRDIPNASSSVFSLQTSVKKNTGRDPAIERIAGELLEIWPEVYARCRSGSVYRTPLKHFDRDFENCYEAAAAHPDTRRLRALLEVFLTRPQFADKSSPGTPGQFVHMLPECDEVLRRSGWKASA